MLSVTRGPSCGHRHPANSYFIAKSELFQAKFSLYILRFVNLALCLFNLLLFAFLILLAIVMALGGGGGEYFLTWAIRGRVAGQGMVFWPRYPKQGIYFVFRLS